MPKQQLFLTPVQDIAINLVFRVMEERKLNRTLAEYAAIAAKLPPLKIVVHQINELLRWMHERSADTGLPLPELRKLKEGGGDKWYIYKAYPRKISYETVRKALEVFGLRAPRGRRAKSL